jgi:NAD(P)-dependent dehydrogenase (short-subunit alcohol dehydrogenase family)
MTSSSGRAFVVTGGTGALGQAVVAALVGRGDRVAVPYRGDAGFAALRTSTGADEGTLWGARASLEDGDATREFFDAAAARLGRLDGVAALAGGYRGGGSLEAAPASDWPDMMAANLTATWSTCRAALPHLLKEGGSVVTVSSRLASAGGAGSAAYAVSKAGVEALTRVLALENRERGVRFNAIAPVTIDTPKNRAAMPKADPSRWTSPQVLARLILFLLSPDSAPLTGAILPAEGP